MIFDKHADLKYKFGNRYFWAQGYYEFLFKRGCKDNISCFMQAYLYMYFCSLKNILTYKN